MAQADQREKSPERRVDNIRRRLRVIEDGSVDPQLIAVIKAILDLLADEL